MLKQRVITAAVLAPLLLAAILYLPPAAFALLTAVVISLAAWEWAGLSGLSGASRVVYGALIALLSLVFFYLPRLAALMVLGVALAIWLLNLIWVLGYPRSQKYWSESWIRVLIGLPMMLGAWVAINLVFGSPQGVHWLLLLLFMVWAADIGAYFSGRWWGKTKLAPRISPGKTWMGYLGGLAVACLVAEVYVFTTGFIVGAGSDVAIRVLLLALAVATISVLGDLTESMYKRHRGVKDSSALLPGHGGVLDRIDSLIAVLPGYAILVLFWGSF